MTAHAELDPPDVEEWLAGVSGRLAFDVGANHGRVALDLAHRFERVIAFEPCRESFDLLADAALPYGNVTSDNFAVSDATGDLELAVQEQHIAQGQLSSPNEAGDAWAGMVQGRWGQVIGHRTVAASTLDDLVDAYGAPDFVKVDVEGHELRVVRGGLELFETVRPRFYIEVHHDDLGQAIRRLFEPHYPDLRAIAHPGYSAGEFGHRNHYWLVSGDPS